VKLLSTGNAKTVKGEAKGYLTFILHLAPSWLSGYNTCPMASAGCAAACLNTAGRGRFTRTQEARIRKTAAFYQTRDTFLTQLVQDIHAAIRKADRMGLTPVFRLNATSDIRWENIPVPVVDKKAGLNYIATNIMAVFPNHQFYDYTKIHNRRNVPANYHLTFSRSESNHTAVMDMLNIGMNVAIVFNKLPKMFMGRPVIDGTETDLRFLDSKNVIVGLLPKGKAKKDTSGFVVNINLEG